MKKLVSILLAIIMFCSVFTVSAFAQDGELQESEQTEQPIDSPQEEMDPLSKYVFKIYSKAEAEAAADAIVANSQSWVVVAENGDIIYCSSVSITGNPEIANLSVLKATAKKLIEIMQNLYEQQGINPSLFDRYRFTGELTLHVLAMLVMESLIESMWPDFDSYYEMFSSADMNPDEDRVPQALMQFLGIIILGLF